MGFDLLHLWVYRLIPDRVNVNLEDPVVGSDSGKQVIPSDSNALIPWDASCGDLREKCLIINDSSLAIWPLRVSVHCCCSSACFACDWRISSSCQFISIMDYCLVSIVIVASSFTSSDTNVMENTIRDQFLCKDSLQILRTNIIEPNGSSHPITVRHPDNFERKWLPFGLKTYWLIFTFLNLISTYN